MKITDRQMVIDYLTSAALVSSMKEIDGQKLTRQDQQAVTIDLINRALVLLDENSLTLFLENSDIDAEKNRTDFLLNLAMRSFNFINNNEEFISPNEEHESHSL